MNFTTFLETFITGKTLPAKHVFIFHGASYPILFFAKFIEQIKKQYYLEVIDVVEQDFSANMSRLQTSFLGQSVFYWLKNGPELDEKKANKIVTYLQEYQGPHTVICFLQTKSKPTASTDSLVIDMDEVKVDRECFALIMRFMQPSLDAKKLNPVVKYISSRRLSISLDEVCLISQYLSVCTTVGDDFLEWLDTILFPDKALFTLSQSFFSKNISSFHAQWQNQSPVYAEAFWLSFWSEQLWRACAVIDLYEKKEFSQAKTMAFRLPFSFIQKDWKKYTIAELRSAHDFVYGMDYQLKNGGESFCFDLFYSKFFSGQFR